MTPDPRRVVIAGDWHGNLNWAADFVVDALPALLPDEQRRLVLHVGDFGVWPGRRGERYLDELADALETEDAEVWFVDGNHEDHPRLRDEQTAFSRVATDPVHLDGTDGRVWWLPRGHRWTWHGRTWVAAGGAVSVDRALRREGLDWWPEEAISEADHARIVAGGPADVMVCHDAPTSVPMTFGPRPRVWALEDLARADVHRDRLQAIVDDVRPGLLLHGHYHRFHDQTVDMGHGPVRVVGLDRDGSVDGNVRVLDVAALDPGAAVQLAEVTR